MFWSVIFHVVAKFICPIIWGGAAGWAGCMGHGPPKIFVVWAAMHSWPVYLLVVYLQN